MATISDILKAAQARAAEKKLSYEGELLPVEAFELLKNEPSAKLVDVRTRAELDYVGRIPGAEEVEWEFYPDGKRNPHFLEQLRKRIDPNSFVLFICRSGSRSHHAAEAAVAA